MASVEIRTNVTGNTYRVVWREDGKKQGETFPSEKLAAKFRQLVEGHSNRWPTGWVPGQGFADAVPTGVPTFDQWAARSIASRAKANARTRHDYARDIARHLSPVFGSKHLDQITREDVGRWLIRLSRDASPKTVKNVHGLASSIVADAVNAGLLPRNVFKGAAGALPSVKSEEMVFLSRPEFDLLLAHVKDDYKVLVQLLAMTGLRWSEATALTVGDVDLSDRKTITVSRAWKRTPAGTFEIGEPKSRRSRRTLAVNGDLAESLQPLLTGRGAAARLFLSAQGRTVLHSNFRYRVWVPAVRSVQRCADHQDSVEPCRCPGTVSKSPRIHDLRHSHASWLIAAGVPLPAIQRRLGHESITTTIDRYGHLAPEMDDAISAALDRDPAE